MSRNTYSHNENKLLTAVILITLVAFLLSVAIIILAIQADYLLNALNTTDDACNNFYSFTCSSWNKSTASFIPNEEMTQWNIDYIIKGTFETLNENSIKSMSSRKVLKLYRECRSFVNLTEDHLYWLRSFLRDIGGWPVIETYWNEVYYNWLDGIGIAAKKGGIEILVSVASQADSEGKKGNIIKISKPKFVFDVTSSYYQRRVPELAVLLGANESKILYNHISKLKIMDEIIRAGNEEPNNEERLTILNLTSIMPSIDWLKLIQSSMNFTFQLATNETVIIKNIKYFMNLHEKIHNRYLTKRILANYIGATSILMVTRWFYKPLQVSDLFPDIPLRVNGYGSDAAYYCIEFLRSKMTIAVDHLLTIHQRFIENQGEDMISYLIKALQNSIGNSKLLDMKTKKETLQKIDSLVILEDYPKWILRPEIVDRFYRKMPKMESNIIKSTLEILSIFFATSTRESHYGNGWPFTFSITELSALYLNDLNIFVIPKFLKLPPLYDQSNPNYINYASVGPILGYYLLSGFYRKDRYENLSQRLLPISSAKMDFKNRHDCIFKNINSKQTGKKELISQVTANYYGLKLAYEAYKLWEEDHKKPKCLPGINYTTDQLFFIYYGLTWCSCSGNVDLLHSPIGQSVRMNHAVYSINEFLNAFNCKEKLEIHVLRNDQCTI